jgi:glycosyltransferase involved in cell wall biosynthesis
LKLSILIPIKQTYLSIYERLKDQLEKQIVDDVEVLELVNDGSKSIGYYRNELLNSALGKYVCFIDADDIIADDYISQVMEGINKNVDCCSLIGIITIDGNNPTLFEHSIKYEAYQLTNKYERYPNHLNVIRRSIAIQFEFKDISFGEDTDWATQIKNSGLIKTEHYINKPIYFYEYITQKSY